MAFCLLPCCCCSDVEDDVDHEWLPLAPFAPQTPETPEEAADLGEFALDLSVGADESLARLVTLPLLASDARRESLT